MWLFRICHSTMSYILSISTINKSIQENSLRYKILLENTILDKIFGTTMNFRKYMNIFSKLAPPPFLPINVVFVRIVAATVNQSFLDSHQSEVYFSHNIFCTGLYFCKNKIRLYWFFQKQPIFF